MIPTVVKQIEDTYSVREHQRVVINRATCVKDFKVPALYKKGVEADLVIFFSAEPIDPKINGFAAACEMHKTTMRPIAGRVNFNSNNLKLDSLSQQA